MLFGAAQRRESCDMAKLVVIFFWIWMDYGWRRVAVLLAKIFLCRLVILYSFIGTRGITGHILFGVAQRRKFSSMVKLVFIFIWVLDGLNIYVHGWRGSVLVPVFLLVFVKLLAMKQYRCGPQEHCFSFGYHIIDSLCFH